jgi:hypothetical protein
MLSPRQARVGLISGGSSPPRPTRPLALLPHRGRVEITVRVSPERTIPGIGIDGFTGPKGNVAIAIDPSHTDLRHTLETWIPATVAHELHHSSRMRVGPGYGVTLGQAIVSEGLADRFAYEVFPDTPPQPGITRSRRRRNRPPGSAPVLC